MLLAPNSKQIPMFQSSELRVWNHWNFGTIGTLEPLELWNHWNFGTIGTFFFVKFFQLRNNAVGVKHL